MILCNICAHSHNSYAAFSLQRQCVVLLACVLMIMKQEDVNCKKEEIEEAGLRSCKPSLAQDRGTTHKGDRHVTWSEAPPRVAMIPRDLELFYARFVYVYVYIHMYLFYAIPFDAITSAFHAHLQKAADKCKYVFHRSTPIHGILRQFTAVHANSRLIHASSRHCPGRPPSRLKETVWSD